MYPMLASCSYVAGTWSIYVLEADRAGYLGGPGFRCTSPARANSMYAMCLMSLMGLLMTERSQYILSVYYIILSFSDRVVLPLHNTLFPGVLMKSIGAAFFRPDALPGVNHMRGMQYVFCI